MASLYDQNRRLRMMSRCREALLRAGSAEEMMAAVCHSIVEEGGHALAWTGLAVADGSQALVGSQIHGTPAGRFAAAEGGWQVGGACRGAALAAMRDGEPQLLRGDQAEFGFPVALAIPLCGEAADAVPPGVLCVYSSEASALDSEEVGALQELAADLALGLDRLRQAGMRRAACHASHDPATGLANRALFNDRLEQALMAAGRSGRRVAVLALTMDRYRGVKASLGNGACDALLAHAASAMKSSLRAGDTVARLLGNEFAVIVADMGCDEDVLPIADKLLAAVKEPMRWQDNIVSTTASIGIALAGDAGSGASGMLRAANSAMAQAQGHGGNRFRFVAAQMNERASRKFALEAELRRAIVHNELVLQFQPLGNLGDGSLAGAEARVCWQHPTRGLQPCADFIPLAESSGLDVPVGAWMIREVCRQLRTWREAGLPMVPVCIPLSPRQFREEGLVEHIEVALEETKVPPAMLAFETNEAMQGGHGAARLRELKGTGVRLSLGGHGSVHSALSGLRSLPLDQLKIERSYVRLLGEDQSAEAICRSLIDVAHNLDLRVVAEGVETLLQREWLRAHGCDGIEGSFYARTAGAADFAQLLTGVRPRSNTMLPLWRAINYKG